MKLRFHFRPRPAQVITFVFTIIAAFFLLRTALWESAYYQEKEGSKRAVAPVSDLPSTTALVETMPAAAEIIAYEVPEGYPRYLNVADLAVKNARILSVGLTDSGSMATPVNIYDAAWYDASALPGQGGVVVINGHNGADQRGIFKDLKYLKTGATIEIEVGGGSVYTYQVVENVAIPLAEADAYMPVAMSSPAPGQESLTLISCSGRWLYDENTYDHRQFVRALKIN